MDAWRDGWMACMNFMYCGYTRVVYTGSRHIHDHCMYICVCVYVICTYLCLCIYICVHEAIRYTYMHAHIC